MEDIRRLERERDALRQWAEDARCTLRGRSLDALPRGGGAHDLSDVVENAMQRSEMYARQSQRIDGEIAERLKLRNPIYEETASYGHVGREPKVVTKTFHARGAEPKTLEVELFTWEKLDYVDAIREALGL